jgi:hypothetical protein
MIATTNTTSRLAPTACPSGQPTQPRPGPSASASQVRWVAYVMHHDAALARYRATVTLLRAAGLAVVPHRAARLGGRWYAHAYESGTRTQHAVWQRIASDARLAPDDFALVVEDDLALHPTLDPAAVLPILECTASLSLSARLPFFYAGICGPHYHGREFAAPAADRRAEAIRHVQVVRSWGLCAHAVAIRRSQVGWLLEHTLAYANDSTNASAGWAPTWEVSTSQARRSSPRRSRITMASSTRTGGVSSRASSEAWTGVRFPCAAPAARLVSCPDSAVHRRDETEDETRHDCVV